MDKNLVYRSLYLHFVKGLKINEVSNEVGLRASVIRGILQGVREPEVAKDFFEDRKTGDFCRTYPEPKYKKLTKIDYAMLEQRYLLNILHDVASVDDIKSYLLEDAIEPKQAKKILKRVTALSKQRQGELLDKKLNKILDVLAMPCKWSLRDTGLVTVYPVPVLDEKYNVIAVEFKPSRSFYIPDELWSRFLDNELFEEE
jgi:hypothetical protein